METLLGLLLILLPLIFKAVEKKLQASGKPAGKPETDGMPEEGALYDALPEENAPSEVIVPVPEARGPIVRPVSKDVHKTQVAADGRHEAQSRRSGRRFEPAAEHQQEKRIDPKKLILYSEIMKPKYDE